MSPQKQAIKRKFLNILETFLPLLIVSTATDYNFKATELNKQNKVLSLYLLHFHLCHVTVGFLNH